MKVVDMFACRLPVVAVDFTAIGELVKVGQNGCTFSNEDERGAARLAAILARLLTGFPTRCTEMNAMRRHLTDAPLLAWEENWRATAYPLIDNALYGGQSTGGDRKRL